MKVGRKRLSEDVERVAAMRNHLGSDFPLMVDANMRWTADEAIRAARSFAPYDVAWLEEPISPDDFAGHARIVREGGLPIAAGENLRTYGSSAISLPREALPIRSQMLQTAAALQPS
jgi:L-alanine-DL-glutamate epimerase-like enolase superfamily enzyme